MSRRFLALILLAASLGVRPVSCAVAETVPMASPLLAWGAYWDTMAVEYEIAQLSPAMTDFGLFACYFDKSDQLYIPDETLTMARDRRQSDDVVPVYLTVTNDIHGPNGDSAVKDRDLLTRLFSDEDSRANHAHALVETAKLFRMGGIELDYENFGNDPFLWQGYSAFIQLMVEKTAQAGLPLRVVLEPSALTRVEYPEGPQYAVMCYNLFGYHSGAGPKADTAFITQLMKTALRVLPGKCQAAFSTGGFAWGSDGGIDDLTEEEAVLLIESLSATPTRDKNSGALKAVVKNSGITQEIWYADGQTLATWVDAARKVGVEGFSLWRLGGNLPESLEVFRQAILQTE